MRGMTSTSTHHWNWIHEVHSGYLAARFVAGQSWVMEMTMYSRPGGTPGEVRRSSSAKRLGLAEEILHDGLDDHVGPQRPHLVSFESAQDFLLSAADVRPVDAALQIRGDRRHARLHKLLGTSTRNDGKPAAAACGRPLPIVPARSRRYRMSAGRITLPPTAKGRKILRRGSEWLQLPDVRWASIVQGILCPVATARGA